MPWFRDVRSSKLVVLTGVVLSILPDIDVLAFRIGIPYAHTFGHRGFTHSLFFAALVSAVCAWIIAGYLKKRVVPVWVFLFMCMASHGVIDAFTNGGYGIAFLSPFSNERYFFPVQPLEVSTLSIRRFFQGQGIGVLISEIQWVWLPCMVLFTAGLYRLKISRKSILKER